MRLLAATSHLSQRHVASLVGVSLGKANYFLPALIAKGFATADNYRNSRNELVYPYLLAPAGLARKKELTRQFLVSKVKEYEELRKETGRLERENKLVADAAGSFRPEPREP